MILLDKGIYLQRDYKKACAAMNSNEAYLAVLNTKPKPGSKFLPDWKANEIAAKIEFISSIHFPCQESEVIVTAQEEETAEGNRLLTWLYWTNAARAASRKRDAKKKQDKDSKTSCTTDLDADCEDGEENLP